MGDMQAAVDSLTRIVHRKSEVRTNLLLASSLVLLGRTQIEIKGTSPALATLKQAENILLPSVEKHSSNTQLAIQLAACHSAFAHAYTITESPDRAACPRCRQQRLYYCRGCGHHFDEGDSVIDPREFERMTMPGFQRDEIDH